LVRDVPDFVAASQLMLPLHFAVPRWSSIGRRSAGLGGRAWRSWVRAWRVRVRARGRERRGGRGPQQSSCLGWGAGLGRVLDEVARQAMGEIVAGCDVGPRRRDDALLLYGGRTPFGSAPANLPRRRPCRLRCL